MRITGTFIDEITHDIPSQNWGPMDWRRELKLYTRIGIDTLIIIRAGYRNRCIFPSESIPDLLPVYEDLGEVIFALADELGLGVFLGTYDSGYHWLRRSWWKEAELNRRFVHETAARYGHHRSWQGWYLTHETGRNDAHIIELFQQIGGACREAKKGPILISPYPQGAKQAGEMAMTIEESMEHWDQIFSEAKGCFDICAFQDGQVHYQELPAFTHAIAELGKRHGITIWSNLETFDRDMPIKFPPADWRNLRFKLETAAQSAEKIITFEFPHFMSPHSCYPAAHNLFRRYCEHFSIRSEFCGGE